MKCPLFLISYNEDGLFSVDYLIEQFADIGEVTVRYFDYKRFRSNQSKLPHEIRECIITVQKN